MCVIYSSISNGIGKNKVVVKAVDDVSFQIPKGETIRNL